MASGTHLKKLPPQMPVPHPFTIFMPVRLISPCGKSWTDPRHDVCETSAGRPRTDTEGNFFKLRKKGEYSRKCHIFHFISVALFICQSFWLQKYDYSVFQCIIVHFLLIFISYIIMPKIPSELLLNNHILLYRLQFLCFLANAGNRIKIGYLA